jgi:hypothetical protein
MGRHDFRADDMMTHDARMTWGGRAPLSCGVRLPRPLFL